jgi:taurine dioxygenase
VFVRALSSALGCEVSGLERGGLETPAVKNALLEHQLLLVRGLDLDPAGLGRLARGLGPLRPVFAGTGAVPGYPDIQELTNAATGRHPDPDSLRWHTDGSALAKPPRFTLLYAVQVPDSGGETSFADMYAACAALPRQRQRALARRQALHDVNASRTPTQRLSSRRASRRASVRHPVIRRHEESGRASLYLGDHAWRIEGPFSRSRRLADDLNRFATSRDEWIYTHAWQPGDLLVWDNRCLLHRGTPHDSGQARVMLRAVVI